MSRLRSDDPSDLAKDAKFLREYTEALQQRDYVRHERPLNWGFKCALLAFASTVVWMVFRQGYSESVLERSLIALAVFGVAGYLLGRYIEPAKPLPEEPDRWKGQPISVAHLKSGMILCETVRNDEGDVLIESGTTLSDELISVLREYQVKTVMAADGSGERGPGYEAEGRKGGEMRDRGVGGNSVDQAKEA
jgi:hypothetical protein